MRIENGNEAETKRFYLLLSFVYMYCQFAIFDVC